LSSIVIAFCGGIWKNDVNIPINGSNAQFKVDTGVDVTVLSKKSYDLLPDKPIVNKTNITLKSVNFNVTVHGYFVLFIVIMHII